MSRLLRGAISRLNGSMKLGRTCAAIAGVLIAAMAGNTAALCVENKPLPFQPGETLTYDVNWSLFHAGELKATLEKATHGSDDALRIKTTAQSQGFVSLLYKVTDEFNSVFNPQTLCSQQISKTINEGRRHKQTTIIFDSVRKVAILDEKNVGKPEEPLKHNENEIPGCVQDIISAFYYVRSQPLRVGETLDMAVNDGSKTKHVALAVLGKEQIQTPMGTQKALRTEPRVFGNLYEDKKGKMVIWFSDDSHHYPLRIKAMLKVGTITGTLISVSPAPEPSVAASQHKP